MVGALEVSDANLFEPFGNLAMLRHGLQQGSRLRWLQIHAAVLARWCIRIVVRLRQGVLGIDGMDEGKCQQVPAARESSKASFEGIFPHARIGVRCQQISLADDIQWAGCNPLLNPEMLCS